MTIFKLIVATCLLAVASAGLDATPRKYVPALAWDILMTAEKEKVPDTLPVTTDNLKISDMIYVKFQGQLSGLDSMYRSARPKVDGDKMIGRYGFKDLRLSGTYTVDIKGKDAAPPVKTTGTLNSRSFRVFCDATFELNPETGAPSTMSSLTARSNYMPWIKQFSATNLQNLGNYQTIIKPFLRNLTSRLPRHACNQYLRPLVEGILPNV